MGIVTTSSHNAFDLPPEAIYDFVTNPANWPKTYPGSTSIEDLPGHMPLQVGDTWREGGEGHGLFTWQLALAERPKLWMFTSLGRLGHDVAGAGGMAGRITVEYRFTTPGRGITLFTRTMTVEADRDAPMPDDFFRIVNPANIDRYHAAIARELAGGD